MATDWGMSTDLGNRQVGAMMTRVLYMVRTHEHPTLVANRLSELTALIRKEHPEVTSERVQNEIRDAVLDTADRVAPDGDVSSEIAQVMRWH